MNDNKIIKFPMDKVKHNTSNDAKATIWQRSSHLRKATPVITLVILGFYTFSNSLLLSKTEETAGLRQIASLSSTSEFQRDVEWEHRLANQLSTKSQKRGIASVATTPVLQDELTAGLLHNKYRVEFSNGKIINIELADTLGAVDPSYIDGYHFLRTYKQLMPFKYDKVVRLSKVQEENKIHETFNLLDSKKKVIGNVHFAMDLHGRLLVMKVQNPS
ncbi:MAG: hypothetical protein H6625_07040 [Bdellovibrionaceae bacterium]|nr:hypothetical protein [Pseudobdellovibrionaceae bacterium]